MNSILLQAAAKPIMIFKTVLSIYFLLRGHNHPGGGFIGGLLLASAFVFYTIAYDIKKTRSISFLDPQKILAIGLLLSLAVGLLAPLSDQPYLEGIWLNKYFGTPLLFDLGVYLVVFGMVVGVTFSLYGASHAGNDSHDRN